MSQIIRPAVFNAREKLHVRGLSREVVGGKGVQVKQFDAQGNIAPIIRERGLTYPLNVTAASVEMFPIDVDRKFIYLLNNDPLGVVWVTFGGACAVVGQGMRLAPGGGGMLLDQNVPTNRIYMIGTIANNPNVTAVVG
jgi:hypothetical protein